MIVEQLRVITTDTTRYAEIPSEGISFGKRVRTAWGIVLGADLRFYPRDVQFKDLRTPLRPKILQFKRVRYDDSHDMP